MRALIIEALSIILFVIQGTNCTVVEVLPQIANKASGSASLAQAEKAAISSTIDAKATVPVVEEASQVSELGSLAVKGGQDLSVEEPSTIREAGGLASPSHLSPSSKLQETLKTPLQKKETTVAFRWSRKLKLDAAKASTLQFKTTMKKTIIQMISGSGSAWRKIQKNVSKALEIPPIV